MKLRLPAQLLLLVGLAGGCSTSRTVAIEAACEAGDANACEVLAAMYLLGKDVEKDEAKASGLHRRVMALRSKACSEGDKEACSKLGMAVASVPLDLPRAAKDAGAGDDAGTPLVFRIALLDDGRMIVNDKPVENEAALMALAEEQVKASPDCRAVIQASASVRHGQVIRVLDILKQAGLTKIAFGVSPAGSAAP
ncbi:MAG: biopolymer transporter ExbD [Polyangiaceae bacterium]|nr:biopolymer transporter ExbD [Polyangiaceae bacterium]